MSWWGFKPTKARAVKGGIRAQSKRGSFGTSWWAQRWIQVLESFDLGSRLGRGRTYARKGQVISIDVGQGKVKAEVQGSASRPYKVTIEVEELSSGAWKKAIEALSGQAVFAAGLLAGEMPKDIEDVFRGAGLSLFPDRSRDLKTACSCPDWSNPCKHIAAVYYLLGEEFDRDPFLIFALRGMEREAVVEALGATGAGREETGPLTPPPAPEPLAAEPSAFWGTEPPEGVFGEVRQPPVPAALPRRLGGFPFWRGRQPLLDAIAPVYEGASRRGASAFVGEGR